jgi:hypothetical protein
MMQALLTQAKLSPFYLQMAEACRVLTWQQKFLPSYLEFLFNTPSESIRSVDSSNVKKYRLIVSFHFKLAGLNDLIKNTFNL